MFNQLVLNFIFSIIPNADNSFITFIISNQTTTELLGNQSNLLMSIFDDCRLFLQVGNIGNPHGNTRNRGFVVTQILDAVKELRGLGNLVLLVDFGNDIGQEALLKWRNQWCIFQVGVNIFTLIQEVLVRNTIQQIVIGWLIDVVVVFWHDAVEDQLTNTGNHDLTALFISKWLLWH